MAKPIFVIRYPYDIDIKDFFNSKKIIEQGIKDYHVIAVPSYEAEEIEFECYNIQNTTDIEIEEFKKLFELKIIK